MSAENYQPESVEAELKPSNSLLAPAIADDLWARVLSQIEQSVDPQIFAAFVKPIKLDMFDLEKGELSLIAPSKLIATRINESFKDNIALILSRMLELNEIVVRVSVDPSAANAAANPAPYIIVRKGKASVSEINTKEPLKTPSEHNINPKYTFSSFVVGNNNQFCHAAALRVSESPGQSYNPLFIYGGVGLGKTHLLHAIGNAVLSRKPEAKVLYMSSETFTNELIQSLRLAKMDEFKNRLRNIEVLLIDDIQFMCGKERTQEEFFHTFNALYGAKHQIVITSDKIPQEIPGIEERLQTRFSWGLTADLQAPDFETRVAILNRKALLDGVQLPGDVATFIAEKFSSNIRELEGALTRLHASTSLQGHKVTLEMASAALKPLLQPKTIRVSVSDIKRTVAEFFNIKVSEMISKRRTKNLSFPRHIGMYLCRKHTTCSYPEIGGHFGGRDHSSVIHAANVVASKIEGDPSIRGLVNDIEKRLLGN